MFGFVRPYEDKLSEEQKRIFKSYYCGVCKSMEYRYTHAARFTLTYDCAFLAMFLASVTGTNPKTKDALCVLRKRDIATGEIIDYCADMNIILAYYKLEDDVNDNNSKKARLAMAALKKAFEKARIANGDAEKLIKSNLEYLYLLEKEKCQEPERVADAFGRLLEGIVGYGCSMNAAAMGVGYNLGKYIYLLDAYVDYKKDIKDGSYNVFYLQYGEVEDLKERITFLMEATLSEMARFYNQIQIKDNKEMLDNILYLGIIQEMLKPDNHDKSAEREK